MSERIDYMKIEDVKIGHEFRHKRTKSRPWTYAVVDVDVENGRITLETIWALPGIGHKTTIYAEEINPQEWRLM